jgi:hypothetical protein
MFLMNLTEYTIINRLPRSLGCWSSEQAEVHTLE